MHIRRISFVGVKTESFDGMADLARDVLGPAPDHRDEGFAVFQLESGDQDLFEVCRPGRYDARLLPSAAGGLAIAFEVDDVVEARAELTAAGVETVADTVWAVESFGEPRLEGFGWLFFRAPDGNINAMQQDHAPSKPRDRGGA